MNALKDAVEAQDARMTLDTPTSAVRYSRWRFIGLVTGHVVVGWIGASMAYSGGRRPTLWAGAFLGLMLSQAGLLGIWGSLGTSPWEKRLIGAAIGCAYLVPVLGIGIYEVNFDTFLVVVMVTSFVAIPLLIARLFRIAILLDDSSVASVSRIQFSIRHLLILTFVVAVLSSIARLIQPLLIHGLIIDLLPITLAFGFVGILPVWFVLATKWPTIYSFGVVVVGAGVGYCLGLYGRVEFMLMTAAAIDALSVVMSLRLVRFWGYRLVRLPSTPP